MENQPKSFWGTLHALHSEIRRKIAISASVFGAIAVVFFWVIYFDHLVVSISHASDENANTGQGADIFSSMKNMMNWIPGAFSESKQYTILPQ